MVSITYPFPPVILMWVYLELPSLLLKELCTRIAIPDFNKLCGIDLYKVGKSYVWIGVAVRTCSWTRDDNKLVEFLTIHSVLDGFSVPDKVIFNGGQHLVSRHDKFVAHLLEAATKPCLTGTLRNFGVQCK